MATIDVKDAAGATVAIEKPLAPSRAPAAVSRPVVLSNEDFAILDGLETAIASTNTKLDTVNTNLGTIDGRVDGLETLITSTNPKLDTAITALQIIDNMVLAAGTANIGDVDVLTVPADPFGANADAASVSTSISAKLKAIATALGTTALDLGASGGGSRTLRVAFDTNQFPALPTTAQAMSAGFQLTDTPTDGTGAQRPVAIAHGTNPTAVAAAAKTPWYANRAGVPFVIGGHMNTFSRSATIDAADGAQTNASLLTISSGLKIVITSISVSCSATNSVNVAARIGFAAATLPAASEAGVAGMLIEGKWGAGLGQNRGHGMGIVGVGGDGEDLRITCDSPTGGSLFVTFSGHTIES